VENLMENMFGKKKILITFVCLRNDCVN